MSTRTRKPVMKCTHCHHARTLHYDPIERGGNNDICCYGGGPIRCRCTRWQNEVEADFRAAKERAELPEPNDPPLALTAQVDLTGLEDAIRVHQQELAARCDRLRETAEELRTGAIHPAHAANRVRKIANEISKRRMSE